MEPKEYVAHDGALGLADLVARGEVSLDEVLEAALAAIDAHNPGLNAVIARRDETRHRGGRGRAARRTAAWRAVLDQGPERARRRLADHQRGAAVRGRGRDAGQRVRWRRSGTPAW